MRCPSMTGKPEVGIAKLTMPLFPFVAAAGAGLTVFLHFLCAAS